jgi:endonuclease/exonuclease/phosphatase family metal-dependent hydrolase
MTYNVHSCIGLDQRHDARRIARVIAHYHPDVVALQELDVGHARSGGLHQARQIAALLRFEYHFHSVREVQDQKFGNAILSRYPLEIVKVGALPGGRPRSEARGALWVEVEVAGRRIQVLNTHLGLGAEERYLQVKALLGDEWLGAREAGVPLIVCGDLNCGPGSPPYRLLSRELADCQLQPPRYKARNTWFSSWPLLRLDHIFVSDPLITRHIHIPTFQLAKTASDHLPLIADISLPPPSPPFPGDDHVA